LSEFCCAEWRDLQKFALAISAFEARGSRLAIVIEAALFAFNLFQFAPEFGVGETHSVPPDEQEHTGNASRQSGYRSEED